MFPVFRCKDNVKDNVLSSVAPLRKRLAGRPRRAFPDRESKNTWTGIIIMSTLKHSCTCHASRRSSTRYTRKPFDIGVILGAQLDASRRATQPGRLVNLNGREQSDFNRRG